MNEKFDLRGKVCLVTGANSGIGKASAAHLARAGASVVLACRDRARGEAAQREIQADGGDLLVVDLASPKSVREAAANFLGKYDRLDVLVNNAGVFRNKREVTPDGWEMMFATNHLGHFLLTTLLLVRLKASAPARVITVSAPTTSHLNFDDLQGERKFSAIGAFGASKMANLLFSFGLARRLAGTGVTSNALHPGLVRSNLMNDLPFVLRWGLNLVSTSPERAAAAVLYHAAAPTVAQVTGEFFKGQKEIKPDAYATDQANQDRLWEISEKLMGLGYAL